MKKIKLKKFIGFTGNKAKLILFYLLAIVFTVFLLSIKNDAMFYTEETTNPKYTTSSVTKTLAEDFVLEQEFTPEYDGLTRISLSYRNVTSLDKTPTIDISILNDNDETIFTLKRSLLSSYGRHSVNIPITDANISEGSTYTLKVEAGATFFARSILFETGVTTNTHLEDVFVDGEAVLKDYSLKLEFEYNYFFDNIYFFCWILAILACLLLIVYIRLPFKGMVVYNIIVAMTVPYISFVLVEWLNFGNAFEIYSTHVYLNLAWYYMVYALLFVFTNSLRASLVTGTILFYICGLTNHYTILFRGTTVLPSDIFAVGTALKVFEQYQFTLSIALICSFLILLCIVQLSSRANLRLPKLKYKLIVGASIISISTIFCVTYLNAEFLESVGLTPYQWKQTSACRTRGLAANFTSNIPSLIVQKPDVYDPDTLDEIFDEDSDLFDDAVPYDVIDAVLPPPGNVQPNIIAIMNETFADLSYLGDLKTNVDPLSYYNSLEENVIKGRLTVPVFGAGTSNSEFEFLTGDSISFLPFSSVPYQQFVTEYTPSLVSTLNDQGYQSLAIHPYAPGGWSRDSIYPKLGFEEFYHIDDFSDADKLRWYVSDQSSYEKVIDLYETQTTDQPLFAFNVTMQNHGGYDYKPFSSTVKLQGYSKDYPDVEQYLSVIKASDDALKYLLDYFSGVDEPTIVVMFGDHLPKISNDFYAELMQDTLPEGETPSDVYAAYQTPFIIWANYDLGVDEPDFGDISSNYLSSLMLEISGLETTDYNDFLMDLMKEIPVLSAKGSFDRNGTAVDITDTDSTYTDMLSAYRSLQYNSLNDFENIQSSLFTIDK